MTAEHINYIFYRSCVEKKNFSEEEANDVIDRVLANEQRLMYYYKCPFCSSFHLTKNEPNNETMIEII